MRQNAGRTQAIVDAALDLAEERGVVGITTAALAGKLEFTEAALYRYFPGKDAIIAAAMNNLTERVFATMLLELVPYHAPGHEPEAQLRRHIDRFTFRSGLLVEMLLYGAAGRESLLRAAGAAFVDEYTSRMTGYFDALKTEAMLASTINSDELARLWCCQLLGGYVRSMLAQEPWDPADQPGYRSFMGFLRG
jgi:AcrR family transcriptional regulator